MTEAHTTEERGLVGSDAREVAKPAEPNAPVPPAPAAGNLSKKQMVLAFAIAGISDGISMWTEFAPPVQWAIDFGTAFLLFLVIGWRWFLLPALIMEAIPGVALFPTWVMVVASVSIFGGVRKSVL